MNRKCVVGMSKMRGLIDKEFNINRLKQHRIAQGRSQTFMARQLGYRSTSAYSNIESGKTSLSFINAVKISLILGIDLESLFFD